MKRREERAREKVQVVGLVLVMAIDSVISKCNRSLDRTHVARQIQVNESPGQLNDRKFTVSVA